MQTGTVAGGVAGGVLGGVLGFALGRPIAHPLVTTLVGLVVGGTAGALVGSLESTPPAASTVTLSPGVSAQTVTGSGGTATFVLPPSAIWGSMKGIAGQELVPLNAIGTGNPVAVNVAVGTTAVFNAQWYDANKQPQTTVLTVTANS